MIRLSTCPLQVDPFPALSGKLDDRTTYTTPWDMIPIYLTSQSALDGPSPQLARMFTLVSLHLRM